MKKISQILEKKKYQNKTSIITSSYICWVADQIGKRYHFRSKKFKDGVLVIAVSDNILASEIQIKKSSIINKINKELKQDKIKRIKFIVGSPN